MDHIAVVDGTGPYKNDSYLTAMSNSFCSQIASTPGHGIHYERGPSTDGVRMVGRATRMADFIRQSFMIDPGGRFMLAGYSRGGSAAIMAAERIPNIKITAMFLFDPVARHMSSGGEIIPANVEAVFVAYRSLDEHLLRSFESDLARISGALADNPVLNAVSPGTALLARGVDYVSSDWLHPMRPGFGKTAVKCASPETKYVAKTFKGSHGALGGVGWRDIAPDRSCQHAVARWMTDQMRSVNLNTITLEAKDPVSVWNE